MIELHVFPLLKHRHLVPFEIYVDQADVTRNLGESCSHLGWQLKAGDIIPQDILNGTDLLSSVKTGSAEN